MNTLQIQLCDIQGRLFELSAVQKMDSASFITAFMTGNTAKALDSTYNRMQWAGEEYLMEEITETSVIPIGEKAAVFPKDVLYWIGYLYRYWHFYTGETSKEILKQAPVQIMQRNYFMFHSMDPILAIEDLKEIYRQHRSAKAKQARK